MTTYNLDGLEETLFDENDWSDSIKEENSTEWDEYDEEDDYNDLEE